MAQATMLSSFLIAIKSHSAGVSVLALAATAPSRAEHLSCNPHRCPDTTPSSRAHPPVLTLNPLPPPVPVWVAPFPGLLWKTISNLSLFDTYHTGRCQYPRTEGTMTPPPGYPGPQVPSLFTHPWTGSRQTSSFSCSGLVPNPGCQAPHLISTLR